MGEGEGGAQQVAHAAEVMLVLFDGFNAHPLSGQQGLIARGIARGGHELKVSVTATEEEASSGTDRSLFTTKVFHGNSVMIFT